MKPQSESQWLAFFAGFDRIHVYTVDPGAHAVAAELVPVLQRAGRLGHWWAEGWSARQDAPTKPAVDMQAGLQAGDTLLLGSQTDFEQTRWMTRSAARSGVTTCFVFDHWKNFAAHFGTDAFPDHIVVPDELARQRLLSECSPPSTVHVLPHVALEAAIERVRGHGTAVPGLIAVLLDPTESEDGLGYDWRSTLEDMRRLATGMPGRALKVKPHPRQDAGIVAEWISRLEFGVIDCAIYSGDTEALIAAAEEVWGMTSVALLTALGAGKRIRSFQIGCTEKGRRASNARLDPYVLTERTMPR